MSTWAKLCQAFYACFSRSTIETRINLIWEDSCIVSTVLLLWLFFPPEDDSQFTPDLVVPEGCECILLVCSNPKRGMTYDVIDSGGGVVLRMEDSGASASLLPRRTLLTPSNTLLGQCTRTQRSFPSQTSTEITFEQFACIWKLPRLACTKSHQIHSDH